MNSFKSSLPPQRTANQLRYKYVIQVLSGECRAVGFCGRPIPGAMGAEPFQQDSKPRLCIDDRGKIDINSGSGELRSPALELPMIPIAPREKTAFPPGRPLLVPTGRSFLSSSALPARRRRAHGNACKMILLRDNKVKLPGIISLHDVNPSTSLVKCGNRRNSFSISILEENRSRKGRVRKAFRMITFANPSKQLFTMIRLQKRWGVPPLGALSMPKRPSRPRIVVPSGRARANDLAGFAKTAERAHSGYNLPSQLEGASRMMKVTGSIQWSICDA